VVNYSKITKDTGITSIGLLNMKESLIKNKYLKEIYLLEDEKIIDETNKLDHEFHLVHKLIELTNVDLSFSNNIYFRSQDTNLKLNYLKCFIDKIDHLFFNFHHFDFIIKFQKIKISHLIDLNIFPPKKKFKN
jgi:hypothetical protein